jgi:hypothetical protein
MEKQRLLVSTFSKEFWFLLPRSSKMSSIFRRPSFSSFFRNYLFGPILHPLSFSVKWAAAAKLFGGARCTRKSCCRICADSWACFPRLNCFLKRNWKLKNEIRFENIRMKFDTKVWFESFCFTTACNFLNRERMINIPLGKGSYNYNWADSETFWKRRIYSVKWKSDNWLNSTLIILLKFSDISLFKWFFNSKFKTKLIFLFQSFFLL